MDNNTEKKYPSILRSTIVMSVITTLSRVLGMFRDIGLVLFFGSMAWLLDAFYFAFTIPNLFRKLLGEGALAGAFLPEFVHAREKNADSSKLASSVLTLLLLVTGSIAVVGSLACYLIGSNFIADIKVQTVLLLLAIMLPFVVLICVSALLGAILQSFRAFAIPAAMSIILNVMILAGLGYIASIYWPDTPQLSFLQKLQAVPPVMLRSGEFVAAIKYIAVAVLLAGGLQLLVQYPLIRAKGVKLGLNWDFSSPRLKSILLNMAPTALGLGIVQFNVLIDNFIAYWLSLKTVDGVALYEGATSYLFLGNRLMQLPLGIFAIAVATASFPALSTLAAKDEARGFIATLFSSLKMLLFIMIPAACGMITLAPDIVRLLYQTPDLEFSDVAVYRTSAVLVCLSLGLVFFSMQQLLVRAFYSLKDFKTPVKIAIAMAGLNLVLNLLLIHAPDLYRYYFGVTTPGMLRGEFFGSDMDSLALGEAGLALATSITSVINVILLYKKLQQKIGGVDKGKLWKEKTTAFFSTFGKSIIAAACMSLIVYKVKESMPYGPEFIYRLENVLLPIIAAIFFYPMISAIFVPKEYEAFMNRLRAKKKKSTD